MDLQTSKAKISIDLFPRSHKPITPPKKSHLLATSWHHRQCLIHRPPCFLVARSDVAHTSTCHHLGCHDLKNTTSPPISSGFRVWASTGKNTRNGSRWLESRCSPKLEWVPEFQWNSILRIFKKYSSGIRINSPLKWVVSCFSFGSGNWWVVEVATITDPGTDADPPANNSPDPRLSHGKNNRENCCDKGLGELKRTVEVFDSSFWWFHQVNLVNFMDFRWNRQHFTTITHHHPQNTRFPPLGSKRHAKDDEESSCSHECAQCCGWSSVPSETRRRFFFWQPKDLDVSIMDEPCLKRWKFKAWKNLGNLGNLVVWQNKKR